MTRPGLAVAYLIGGGLVLTGIMTLVSESSWPALRSVALWFGGGVLIHDLVLVPLAMVAGACLVRLVPSVLRAPLAAALILSATVTLPLLALVLGAGRDPSVPSQQPLSYGRNLALVLTAAWLSIGGVTGWRLAQTRRRSGARDPSPPPSATRAGPAVGPSPDPR